MDGVVLRSAQRFLVEQENSSGNNQVDTPPECEGQQAADDTTSISEAILLIIFLLVINELAVGGFSKLKERFRFLRILQATSITTLLGIFAGLFLKLTGIIDVVSVLQESFSKFFLIVFLPPILYESAINMEKRLFYKNIGAIMLYAVFGTVIAIFSSSLLIYLISLTGLQSWSLNTSFAFGALISATDPVAVLSMFKECGVEKMLFTLIFGESILNDAVSILFYKTAVFQSEGTKGFFPVILNFCKIFFGSITTGILIGFASAYALKQRSRNREQAENREQTILMLVPWVSYLVAEGLSLSGIVSIMFCGIAMARYALPNVSNASKKINQHFYHTLAYNCENIVFLFIGIGFVSFDLAWRHMGPLFFILVFFILLIARFFNIYIITSLLNLYRQRNKITNVHQFFMWFSGFRGAMAFALSLKASTEFEKDSAGKVMLTITLLYTIINTFASANILMPLIERFDIIEKPKQENDSKNGDLAPPSDDQADANSDARFWNRFKHGLSLCDENCLQKLLIRNEKQEEEQNRSLHELDMENNSTSTKAMKKNLIGASLGSSSAPSSTINSPGDAGASQNARQNNIIELRAHSRQSQDRDARRDTIDFSDVAEEVQKEKAAEKVPIERGGYVRDDSV